MTRLRRSRRSHAGNGESSKCDDSTEGERCVLDKEFSIGFDKDWLWKLLRRITEEIAREHPDQPAMPDQSGGDPSGDAPPSDGNNAKDDDIQSS
jgi:hypothetical protein